MSIRGPLSGAVVAAAVVLGLVAGGAPADTTVAFDATVVPINPPSTMNTYPTVDLVRGRQGTTRWRVVDGTGNCCENYITITKEGRLLDFGGSYINYTDDRGLTWKSVRPIEPLVNGEGTITVAPSGDILGVEWDPYSGDHLLGFKYDAAAEKWIYNESPLHQPFYDREWVTVVPGPFWFDGKQVPYISFLKGAYPTKELWLYSTDGVNYVKVSSKVYDSITYPPRSEALPISASPDFDWMQGNNGGGATALGGAGALAAPDFPGTDWAIFDGALKRWATYRFDDGSIPAGAFQIDSAGRVHNVIPKDSAFDYRVSADGGTTWRTITVPLPPDSVIEDFDFRANKAVGVAAVAMRAHDSATNTDRDLVYKLDIRKAAPVVTRRYTVGLGDVNAGSAVGGDIRFDFETVAIFPDGRVAVSFLDSTTAAASPALAIEETTKLR